MRAGEITTREPTTTTIVYQRAPSQPSFMQRQVYEGRTPSMTEVERQIRAQLPKGATLTYYTEISAGKYSVSYKLPEEPKEKEKMIRADMSGPFRDWLRGVIEAPTKEELDRAMFEDVAGVAVPITTEQVFEASVAVASIAAPILQKRFWSTAQQRYYASMKEMSKKLYGETALEKAGIQRSPNSEFWLQTQQPTEIRQFEPREQFYRVTRGSWSKWEFGAASRMGSQELVTVPRSQWMMPPALRELTMVPKTIPSTRIFPFFSLPSPLRLGVPQTTITLERPEQIQRIRQIQGVRQLQKLAQVTETIQEQTQEQSQIQRMVQAQATTLRTTAGLLEFDFPRLRPIPRFGRRESPEPLLGKGFKELLGKWYFRRHPFLTPREVLLGKKAKRRKRRR